MSKYIIIMRQAGEGCDHTIGCGVRVDEVEADSRAAAISKAEKTVAALTHPEQTVGSAVVYMVDTSATTVIDVARIRADTLAMQVLGRQGDADERAEYERLRRKFEAPAGGYGGPGVDPFGRY